MARYICTEKCFHMLKLWRPGEIAEFADGEHPVSSELKYKDGTIARKAGEVRHFRKIEEGKPIPAVREESGIVVNVNEIKMVRKEPR